MLPQTGLLGPPQGHQLLLFAGSQLKTSEVLRAKKSWQAIFFFPRKPFCCPGRYLLFPEASGTVWPYGFRAGGWSQTSCTVWKKQGTHKGICFVSHIWKSASQKICTKWDMIMGKEMPVALMNAGRRSWKNKFYNNLLLYSLWHQLILTQNNSATFPEKITEMQL